MLPRKERIKAFAGLGEFLRSKENRHILHGWAHEAQRFNSWSTPENALFALKAISKNFLEEKLLEAWLDQYAEAVTAQKVGVIMAGNIPAVGFHDALATLISGHILVAKLSKDDPFLIRELLRQLMEINPRFRDKIFFADRLNDVDAYIATGSDNTARYFEYYFSKKPHIIRRNRTSLGILNGLEDQQELSRLGEDLIRYYGLGCRNIAKLLVPKDYDFSRLYDALEPLQNICMQNHKYVNNYEYNRSVLLINRTPHFDNGFLIFQKSPDLVSPISVVYFDEYFRLGEAEEYIHTNSQKIQCVVGAPSEGLQTVAYGSTQQPSLTAYADGIDTMDFLAGL